MNNTDTLNLSTIHIEEFSSENTIYIKDKDGFNKPFLLCQFVSYDKNKHTVTGTVLQPNQKHETNMVGKVITNKLSQCGLYGTPVENENRPFMHWFKPDGYALHPMSEYKIVENDFHCEKHPSFGLAYFYRRSSSHGQHLFGSSIAHQNTISLQIKRAEHQRGLNYDHFFGKEELIEIEMSQNQFAELITNMNNGSGIPVTIRHISLDKIADPPYKNKVDIFNEEFKAKMHNMGVDIEKASTTALDLLKNKKSLNNADRELILDSITTLLQEIKSNIPFVSEQFGNQMSKTITEAKGEIEGFFENKIRTLGLEAMKNSDGFPNAKELTSTITQK